jgi:hypothetical protein
MTIKPLVLCIGLVAGLSAFAAEQKASVLKLKNGRTFVEWVILSETATAVVVKHKEGAAKVDKKMLPAELLELYPIDREAMAVEAAALAEVRRMGEMRAADVEASRREYNTRVARNAANHQRVAAETNTAADEKIVQQALRARADRFFRYEYQGGSNYIYVLETSTEFTDISPRPGWPGEYSATGKGYIQFYDSSPHGHFKRESREFAATVKVTNGTAKVLEFRQR